MTHFEIVVECSLDEIKDCCEDDELIGKEQVWVKVDDLKGGIRCFNSKMRKDLLMEVQT